MTKTGNVDTITLMKKRSEHLFSWREVFALILPLTIEQALTISVGMADTIMVSAYSEEAVSAVSSMDLVSVLFMQLFMAFSTGGAVIISQYIGKGDRDNTLLSAKNLVYITFLSSLLLSVAAFILRGALISYLFSGVSETVKSNAEGYFIPVLISYPMYGIFTASSAILRSTGNGKRPMAVSLLMNIVNIVLNYYFIYTADLGAAGAGIATMISRIVGAIVIYSSLFGKNEKIPLSGIMGMEVSGVQIRKLLMLAIPVALDSLLFNVGKLIVQSSIASMGTGELAINAVTANFNSFSDIPGNAIALSAVTVVGRAAGAGRLDEERYWAVRLVLLTMALSGGINLLMGIACPLVISVYKLQDIYFGKAVFLARCTLFSCATIWPWAFVLPQALKAAGDVRYTMFTSIFSMWAFRVFLSVILIRFMHFGVIGAWISMYSDWLARGLMYIIRYRGTSWQRHKVV